MLFRFYVEKNLAPRSGDGGGSGGLFNSKLNDCAEWNQRAGGIS